MNLHRSPAPHVHSPQSTRSLMLNVLIALAPCTVFGVWRFGPSALMVLVVATASAVAAEAVWQKLTRQRVLMSDLSAAVTGLILGLNLPPRAPWWLAVTGSVFAVILVKGLFGGLGDNFVNPALAARAMLLASWPKFMTAWSGPVGWGSSVDAVSVATPLAAPAGFTVSQLFLGDIPGSIGEVCKLAILIGLVWLLVTKTVTWRIPVVMVASTFLFSWLFGKDPLSAILSGGVLFAAVFMATDYVTCPMSCGGQLVYAAGAGALVAVIRSFGGYPEGATYGVLLMNVLAPLLDRCFRRRVYGHLKGGSKTNV
ncbi:MAG: RnfABCDGE type electron transport complex subunit D [Clostridia bacterium]|nr:RnfABCDGE type electron transport complex subunit D [Clostridia bacterium]